VEISTGYTLYSIDSKNTAKKDCFLNICTYLDVIATDILSGLCWTFNENIFITSPTIVLPVNVRISQHAGGEMTDDSDKEDLKVSLRK
jgi:hypothetical protein